jgi:hypothetical protein
LEQKIFQPTDEYSLSSYYFSHQGSYWSSDKMVQTNFKDVEYYPKTRIFKGSLEFEEVTKKFILVFSQDFKKVESGTVVIKDAK